MNILNGNNKISRRDTLKLIGTSGAAAFLAACGTTAQTPVVDEQPIDDNPINTEPNPIEQPTPTTGCPPGNFETLEGKLHKSSIVIPAFNESMGMQWIGDLYAMRTAYGCSEVRLTTEGTQPHNIEGSPIMPIRNEFFNIYRSGDCDSLALKLKHHDGQGVSNRADPNYIGLSLADKVVVDNFQNRETGYITVGANNRLVERHSSGDGLIEEQYALLRESAFTRGGRGMNSHATLYLTNPGNDGEGAVWSMEIGQKVVGESELFPIAKVEYKFLNRDQAEIKVAEVLDERHFDAGLMYADRFEGQPFTQTGVYKVGSWNPEHVSVAYLPPIRDSLGL